ncbi:MAG: LysR family transcriptional regulator [Candidatus Sedimenticola sp. 6PFRAG1]
MELYQLKTFVKVADEGHLTRAAEQLFTSQPAISAHIKALEEELGVVLFQRTPKGMILTPEGELLYNQAMQTLEAAENLKTQARALQDELVGDVRIGIHTDFEFMRIGALHHRLLETYPRVRPHFIQSMSAIIVPDIRKGNLDGGFFFGPCRFGDLSVTRVLDVPMAIVAPVAWRDRIEGADIRALADLPWVYTSENCPFHAVSMELFEDVDAEPAKVAYVDSEDAVRELIRSGAGLSLLRQDDAEWTQEQGFGCVWSGAAPGIELNFAVQKRRSSEPLIKAVSEVIRQLWSLDDPLLSEEAAK